MKRNPQIGDFYRILHNNIIYEIIIINKDTQTTHVKFINGPHDKWHISYTDSDEYLPYYKAIKNFNHDLKELLK